MFGGYMFRVYLCSVEMRCRFTWVMQAHENLPTSKSYCNFGKKVTICEH